MEKKPLRGAVYVTKTHNRRRRRNAVPRTQRVTAWYSDEEMEQVLVFAAAARMAPAAYVAEASLRPSAWKVGATLDTPTPPPDIAGDVPGEGVPPSGAVLDDPPGPAEERAMVLLELMGVHRQLRGAAANLNQAVAKLHSLGVPVDELPAIAEYLRKVATAADAATVAIVQQRRPTAH